MELDLNLKNLEFELSSNNIIGLSANSNEREYFMDLDKIYNYRKKLLDFIILFYII